MSNKKQSSIDKFVLQLKRKGLLITEDSEYIVAYLEAKAMHKEEIKDAYIECWMNDGGNGFHKVKEAEQYYNETFGGTTGGIGVDKISWTNTSGTNHLSHINPLTDKLTNMEVTMSEQNSVVTLIQENESVIKVNKECDCGGRIVKYDKFTEEKYCKTCGWS